jgi:hypothetical protein
MGRISEGSTQPGKHVAILWQGRRLSAWLPRHTSRPLYSEYTFTGTISSDIVMTNVSVTKNYVEQDGAAVSQPVVVMTAARPKLTTPCDSFEKFVVYRLNKIPPLATAEDVGKYAYDYRINFPDTISVDPEFKVVMIVDGYLAKGRRHRQRSAMGQHSWSTC